MDQPFLVSDDDGTGRAVYINPHTGQRLTTEEVRNWGRPRSNPPPASTWQTRANTAAPFMGLSLTMGVFGLSLLALGCLLMVCCGMLGFVGIGATALTPQALPNQAAPVLVPEPVHIREWYEGETLRDKGALEWQVAGEADKLATCADFVASIHRNGGFTPSIQVSIRTKEDLRPFAVELVNCINAATAREADETVNTRMYANQTVKDIAILCMLTMGWQKD